MEYYDYFAAPNDQFHVFPELPNTPYTIKKQLGGREGRESREGREGMTAESMNYLTRMNTGLRANNQIVSTPYILDPQMPSDLEFKNNNAALARNRQPGDWLPEISLADQIKREINGAAFQNATGARLSGGNLGDFSISPGGRMKNANYVYPISVEKSRENLFLNSDGRDHSLGASQLELAYGLGRASGSRDFSGYIDFLPGGATRPIDQNIEGSESLGGGESPNQEGFCGSNCKCNAGCKCIKCRSYEYLKGFRDAKEGMANKSAPNGHEPQRPDFMRWFVIIILAAFVLQILGVKISFSAQAGTKKEDASDSKINSIKIDTL